MSGPSIPDQAAVFVGESAAVRNLIEDVKKAGGEWVLLHQLAQHAYDSAQVAMSRELRTLALVRQMAQAELARPRD